MEKEVQRKDRVNMGKKDNILQVERKYKDCLFRMIFREKKDLLSLYNAVNGTDYRNEDELEVNTLENAIYMNVKNDISFVFDSYMNLYEHQSTYNPNMPLRNLFYIARLLEKEIKDRTLYSTAVVPIPTPKFIVFYNGTTECPEREVLKLSDAFEKKTEEPELELKVLMLNINPGKNQEILEKCKLLHDYMEYVTRVRAYAAEMDIKQAVERAVNECIEEGILREFLLKYKAEAIQMSIFEYDEEKEMKLIREAEYNEGVRRGIVQGIEQGIEQGERLKSIEIVKKSMERFHLSMEEACDFAKISVAEYRKYMEEE